MSNNNPPHAYVTGIGAILSLFCSVSVLNFFRTPHSLEVIQEIEGSNDPSETR